MMPDLIIGGVVVPQHARLDLDQSYSPLGGVARLRLASGALVQQTRWRRLRTEITARGWVPAGLDAIDWDEPVQIDCIATRSIHTTATSVVIPGTVRPDAPLICLARTGTQTWQPTDATLSGDTATITAVSEAVQYQLRWYPRLSVFADPPETTDEVTDAGWLWRLTGEEN